MGISPLSGESLIFDMAIVSASIENDKLMKTTGGKIRAKRAGWSKETRGELRRHGNR